MRCSHWAALLALLLVASAAAHGGQGQGVGADGGEAQLWAGFRACGSSARRRLLTSRPCTPALTAQGVTQTSSVSTTTSSSSSRRLRGPLPRRGLAQSPANPALVDALQARLAAAR